jgi:hypothetical protein
VSAQWDDLPEEVRAELTREGYWSEAPGLEDRIRELNAQATRLAEKIAASMAQPLDPSVFTGAQNPTGGLPNVVQGEVLHPDGAHQPDTPTREKGASLPDVPHSGEQPTPKDRRRLWDRRHAGLVKSLEGHLRAARMRMPYDNAPHVMVEHLAEEWACLQLLKSLRDMKAPEVPVDHTVDQPTLEEAVEPVCWNWMTAWPHAVRDIARMSTTTDAAQVTCQACLSNPGPWA